MVKNEAIDSYTVLMNELKEAVKKATERGIPKDWSEDVIIAMLPSVFKEERDV